jgi:hypothetical protein
MMDRAEIMAAMGELKLYGMRATYDELMAVAVRRQHEPRQIVGDLLAAEINEKKARSVKYQITTAKLPYAREIEEFTFDDTPINETLVRDLASGEFLSQQRNVYITARELPGGRSPPRRTFSKRRSRSSGSCRRTTGTRLRPGSQRAPRRQRPRAMPAPRIARAICCPD